MFDRRRPDEEEDHETPADDGRRRLRPDGLLEHDGRPGPDGARCADGRVWVIDLGEGAHRWIKAETGGAISGLAMTADGKRLAWGDEDGGAGVVDLD